MMMNVRIFVQRLALWLVASSNQDNCPDGAGGTCQQSRCGDGFVDSEPAGGTEQCESDTDCSDGRFCGPPGSDLECICA
jgi:hypothetical protein